LPRKKLIVNKFFTLSCLIININLLSIYYQFNINYTKMPNIHKSSPYPTNIVQYMDRRNTLMNRMRQLTGGGVAIIHTAPESVRNGDADFPYRYDSNFYYLTGFAEAESIVVLDASQNLSLLFCRAKNIEREIWDGYRWGPDDAKTIFGFDAAYSIEEFSKRLPALLANQSAVYAQLGNLNAESHLHTAFQTLRNQQRQGNVPPKQIRDVHPLLAEQRLIKDASELTTMARAASISAKAHVRAMQACRIGQHEYELEAELLYAFRKAGAQFPAYSSIVATGANSCVLHYRADNTVIKAGDMLLIDAGCELDGYASDITRTFPANGVFSGEQKAVYELVLAAQNACLEHLAPGKFFNEYNDAATRVLAQGLLDFGWLTGSLDSVLEQGSYRQFYMHRAGHWLGMDVHDCGDYRVPNTLATDLQERPWRTLEAGMVLTVEPGLYIRPANNVPEAFWNIGIRIEDDAVINTQGYELTTREAPVEITEIEALMRV
jgi:Xaa-Pro aminopeptidase